jgi:hypothetical protein
MSATGVAEEEEQKKTLDDIINEYEQEDQPRS